MEESLQASWDSQLEVAQVFDDGNRGDHSWVPPIMTALVTAVSNTSLRRLHPFKAMASLGLSTGAHFWEPGAGVKIAPAFVSLDRDGHYNIWSGPIYPKDAEEALLVCATDDPARAAAELERLLADWS